MSINSDANFDGVLAGTCGGMCAGQLSIDDVEDDYTSLVTMGVAVATAVDALVGVTSAPPPLVAQTNILDEISFGWSSQRQPGSGNVTLDAVEIEAALGDTPAGIAAAFAAVFPAIGAGTAGSTAIYLNAATAGCAGGMLAGSVNTDDTSADYEYIATAAYAFAKAIDAAIGVDGSSSVAKANLVCELAYAWNDGRNPNAISQATTIGELAAVGANWEVLAEAIAAVFSVAGPIIASPSPAPANAVSFDAAFAGGLGGMLAGQCGTDDTAADYDSIVAAAAAFAYEISAVQVAADGGELPCSTAGQANMLRQICHAWMKNRNPPDNTAAQTSSSYNDIADGIIAYYALAIAQLL